MNCLENVSSSHKNIFACFVNTGRISIDSNYDRFKSIMTARQYPLLAKRIFRKILIRAVQIVLLLCTR